jgi:leucyl-tRNA synthetase
MFMGPLEAVKPWQTNQLVGIVRFRDRVYNLIKDGASDVEPTGAVLKDMHKTIKKITRDIESMSFNTAISQMMIFTNTLRDLAPGTRPRAALETLAILLSPFAPHLSEECWEMLGHTTSLSTVRWPEFDEMLCTETQVKIAVQISGKVCNYSNITAWFSHLNFMCTFF